MFFLLFSSQDIDLKIYLYTEPFISVKNNEFQIYKLDSQSQ